MFGQNSTPLFEYDLKVCGEGGAVAGVDEAGRGSFAGPLVTAAVVFDYARFDSDMCRSLLSGLHDSKKLTAPTRSRLYPLIIRCSNQVSVAISSNVSIDDNGIHRTNLSDLERCVRMLSPCPELVLIDGYSLPDGSPCHRAVKGGDSLSACIAAASVIAKVTRDRLMSRMHLLYPVYGFAKHFGYGTKAHRDAIAHHGFSPLHRRSFRTDSIFREPDGAPHGKQAGKKRSRRP